jgi:hypothetical protein
MTTFVKHGGLPTPKPVTATAEKIPLPRGFEPLLCRQTDLRSCRQAFAPRKWMVCNHLHGTSCQAPGQEGKACAYLAEKGWQEYVGQPAVIPGISTGRRM